MPNRQRPTFAPSYRASTGTPECDEVWWSHEVKYRWHEITASSWSDSSCGPFRCATQPPSNVKSLHLTWWRLWSILKLPRTSQNLIGKASGLMLRHFGLWPATGQQKPLKTLHVLTNEVQTKCLNHLKHQKTIEIHHSRWDAETPQNGLQPCVLFFSSSSRSTEVISWKPTNSSGGSLNDPRDRRNCFAHCHPSCQEQDREATPATKDQRASSKNAIPFGSNSMYQAHKMNWWFLPFWLNLDKYVNWRCLHPHWPNQNATTGTTSSCTYFRAVGMVEYEVSVCSLQHSHFNCWKAHSKKAV